MAPAAAHYVRITNLATFAELHCHALALTAPSGRGAVRAAISYLCFAPFAYLITWSMARAAMSEILTTNFAIFAELHP